MEPGHVISTILKHDAKLTSYKMALLRAVNDLVLSFPDVDTFGHDVAVPLRVLAEYWFAYYWPFVDPARPVYQGPRATRDGKLRNDMAFRDDLTAFRALWVDTWNGVSSPADGFFVVNEMHVPRRKSRYSRDLVRVYDQTLQRIAQTIEMPVRYAGPGEWTIFDRPRRFSDLSSTELTPIPGTNPNDKCIVIRLDLWRAFKDLSLWVEALCIHEWAAFVERVDQPDGVHVDRGVAYVLLTARPDNRRPLTWERNQIDLLLMEGHQFVCPWTERLISARTEYDLDHLIPVSLYPFNELWNLVPSDPAFNSHKKRDRLPSKQRLLRAEPHLIQAYSTYDVSRALANAMREDVEVRFAGLSSAAQPPDIANAVLHFISSVADSRNVSQF